MQTLEQKATEYATSAIQGIVDKYQSAPWNEFLDALAEIYLAGAKEALASQWISVNDELPKAEQDVLVAVETNTNHRFAFAWLSTLSNGTMRWYCYDNTFSLDNIRFWMPIPEPPKPLTTETK